MKAPSKAIQNKMARATMLRGTLVGSYAHVEFLLADVCVKSWAKGEYRHLAGAFPYGAESRVKAAARLLEEPGPLNQYWQLAKPLFAELERYKELRHFAAHGLMVLTNAVKSPAVEFRMYRPTKAGADIGFLNMSIEQFGDAAFAIASYANEIVMLFQRIYVEQKLEG